MQLSIFGLKWIIYALMILFFAPQPVEAIDISDVQWGFSNRPVAYKINPVTVLVENTEPQPFESEIRLHRETFGGQQIDIALSATIYVAPFEKNGFSFIPISQIQLTIGKSVGKMEAASTINRFYHRSQQPKPLRFN